MGPTVKPRRREIEHELDKLQQGDDEPGPLIALPGDEAPGACIRIPESVVENWERDPGRTR